jgi:Pyruvate/2-oxoacid:ferredoxin oxidoreductase delta subunit
MDQFPAGLVNSQHFYEILKALFSDEEARLCSVMPLHYFSTKEMAKIWGKPEEETEEILKKLAFKGLVYTEKQNNVDIFFLAPPIVGFFEFSLMRLDNFYDKKKLSELYYKYINEDAAFVKKYASLYPYLSRVFVDEDAIKDIKTEVLPFEKANEMIDKSTSISVGICFCRHKMEHMGMACDNPQEVCLTFNYFTDQLINYGLARAISKEEAHQIVKTCAEKGLVQLGDNIKDHLVVLCNCCGCCCDVLLGYKKFGPNAMINPSNFIARVNNDTCSLYGTCIKRCPVNAISLVKGKTTVNRKVCIGCGVCVRFCPTNSIKLESRPQKNYTPESTNERVLFLALREGKIGNFIFDDQTSLLHKILRILINWFVKFPPLHWFLTNRSVFGFLYKIIKKINPRLS